MKTPFNKLVFIFAIVSFLFSCNSSKKELSDREKKGFKENVQCVIESFNDGSHQLIEFDKNGQIQKEMVIIYNEKTPICFSEYSYNYDENKNLISKTYVEYNKKLKGNNSETKYQYKDNKIITATYSGSGCADHSYQYENGLIAKETLIIKIGNESESVITNYKYNDNYELYSTTTFNSMFGRKLEEKYLNGLITSSYSYNKKNDNYILSDSTTNIYNEKNDLTKEIKYNLVDNKVESKTYNYEYDSKNNWIKKTDNEGNVNTRKIFYLGDNSDDILAQFETAKNQLKSSQQSSESIGNQDVNMNSTSNSNSNYNQQHTQSNQKVWVNCKECNGKGIKICTYCSGRGSVTCKSCDGRGWYTNNSDTKHTCYVCGGKGFVKCSNCTGTGNNGTCAHCGGRGQVLE